MTDTDAKPSVSAPDEPQAEGPLQFGRRSSGVHYPDRPAAFAVAPRGGRIALAHIKIPGEAPYYDLPGGGIEPGETAEQAMVREVGEEVGLVAAPSRLLLRADQYLIKRDGTPANNRCTLFEARILGEDARLKIEHDHHLVWLPPEQAIAQLRLDSQAWAVAAWLRSRP